MQHYYNFKVSKNQISFEPYWHHKSYLLLNFILGIIVLVIGITITYLINLKGGLIFSILISTAIFLNSIYRGTIQNKTILLFDKTENAFYKITPLAKKKISVLNSILGITTKSGSFHFNYILILKNKTSIKKIHLTDDIKIENQNNPEVRFLEMEIIPQLESFLNLKKEALIIFDSELINI